MEDLLAARLQMAISLGFHIIFACIGMAMPFLMAIAEYKWIKTGEQVYQDLAKAWSKGVAIFFATGAVSGTVLSFELGLLWPTFMEHAGPIFGMPFSWEGTAFFVEAIALGLFLYGWDKLKPWVHWGTGLVVGISGVASGIFVVAANAWMNSPAGFDWVNGEAINIDPVAAMFNDAWASQAIHMTIAAFVATGFGVAGLHALLLLKDRNNLFHRKALKIALAIGAVAAILQPISGDYSAKDVAERQPAKLAALESHFETERGADLIIGGIPDEENREVHFAIRIPGMLSFLAHGDLNAEVIGLEEFPEDEWPPVLVTHIAFQIMVGAGFLMMFVGLLYLFFYWKKKHLLFRRWFLWLVGICTPLGFIAVEAGWTVTEVGRQPWIIYEIMKTEDALSSMPGLQYPLYLIIALYLLLTVIVSWLMYRQVITLSDRYQTANLKAETDAD
ncbi:cytochrome ubiquinol oxidase subunit I [Gracilimonas mengyeensis]|uniref:Cytochrome bd-I ubiquinol oxidase subunit 1 apoprotein n=1 Tax=Gracilimonas mengyeensis TaxID=1302730 RepID=A0A521CMA0_9BACT|nr:cytochrome ubiquinol oxidase subunit I [Gracilimonas mengyeensis]SMO60579.1 cytochrome bd-I ubiquinol oxidase subunit 1 apoprotein [Gracilimonas mengyeensis]